jgi:hypothetical protein
MPGVFHSVVRWDDPKEAAIFRAEFAAGSRGRRPGPGVTICRYDPASYPLAALITELLVEKGILAAADAARLDDLTQLHRFVAPELTVLGPAGANEVARSFFETNPAFVETYHRLVRDVLAPAVAQGDCLFQRTPTIRFHFAHEQGFIGQPRYHNDLMLGHPPQCINTWLPLCRTRGDSAMRIASLETSIELLESVDLDFGRFVHLVQNDAAFRQRCHDSSAPVELDYGQFVAFDSRCIHAPQHNVSDLTRVSLECRLVPLEDYAAMRLSYRGTGQRRMPFTRGGYYHESSALSL